ncbi:MAG: hypothetical protein LBS10_00210 [Gracilibacteraceae bacterium]|jgi:hypothetical protein|nr:hypothetical protein [Gracilibacteraceae bacterium]
MMKKIGLGLIILGAVLMVLTSVAKSTIIIQMGIRAFSALAVFPFLSIGAGIIALAVGFVPAIKARLAARAKSRREAVEKRVESRPTLSYSAGAYDPTDIRRRLRRLGEQRPDLAGVLARCEAQMDAMDRRQAKLKDLLDLNEAEYLRATEGLLDEVEQFICKNFRKIINRGIVSDLEDDDVFARDEKYSTDLELIEAVLVGNQTELDNTKKFLADLADLVSEQNDNSETTLQAWMQVIRDSLKKEEI